MIWKKKEPEPITEASEPVESLPAVSAIFCGTEKCDLAYYTAKLLAAADHNVAIIDNSECGDMYGAVAGYKKDKGIIIKEDMVYLNNAAVGEDFYKKFDYILYYTGRNFTAAPPCDFTFVAFEDNGPGQEMLRTIDRELLKEAYVICRDIMSGGTNAGAVAIECGIKKERYFEPLMLDEKDEAAYRSLSLSGRQGLMKTSVQMKNTIADVAAIITGMSAKELLQTYRKNKHKA